MNYCSRLLLGSIRPLVVQSGSTQSEHQNGREMEGHGGESRASIPIENLATSGLAGAS